MLNWYKFHESIKWYNKGKFTIQDNIEPLEEYDDFITDDIFRQFLLDNNCYEKYIKNSEPIFRKVFKSQNSSDYIDLAFTWDSTPEGESFWSNIDDKWRSFLYDSYELDESIKWYNKGKFTVQVNNVPVEQYEDFITNDEFRQFLINNNCYEQYIKNSQEKLHFQKKFSHFHRMDYIDLAFKWSSTYEGESFWEDIEDKWLEYLNINEINESIKWYNKGKFTVQDNIEPVEQYDDFITDDEFRQFLLDNGCYDEYVDFSEKSFKDRFAFYHKTNYIGSAFSWSYSISDYDFWNGIHEKWLKYLNINESIKWYNKGKFNVQGDMKPVEQYDDFITDDEFREFLINNNCYKQYIKNCNLKFKEDFNKIYKRNYIDRAFSWIDSPEGDEYWDDINTEWYYYNKTIYNESIKWYNKGKFNVQGDMKPVEQYDDFITDDEFRQFLLDNDCYEQYIKNCIIDFKLSFNDVRDMNYISSAFPWDHSSEGHDFWNELNIKWRSLIIKRN